METRQGIVLEYKKPTIELVGGEIKVIDTTKEKFFTIDEIRSIIEAKERQNLSSRMCYYKKKAAASKKKTLKEISKDVLEEESK